MKRYLLILGIALAFLTAVPLPALLADTQPAVVANLTVPTRTPTPDPNQPTATPNDPDPPPNNPNPTSPPGEATSEPAVTETPATPPTPLPTAEQCSFTPTVTGLNANFVNIRFGPGTDYGNAGELPFREVRPIVGRAADSAWWQITFGDNELGWVADAVVLVSGDPTDVPIIAAPSQGGVTVTPGAPWQPTRPAICSTAVPPTATIPPAATPEDAGAEGESIVVSPLGNDSPEPSATPDAAAYPSEDESQVETAVLDVAAVTPTPTPTPIVLSTAVSEVAQVQTIDSEPATADSAASEGGVADVSGLLLLGAAGLFLAGLAVVVVRRRAT